MTTLEIARPVSAMVNRLVLVRHGESEWNKRNMFTGIRNPGLTDKGVIEARWAGRVLKQEGLSFDKGYTSKLSRAQHTLHIMLAELDTEDIPVTEDAALNERDYGDLAGLNKQEAKERWGEEQVSIWRRSFSIRPPGGESLEDTAARVIPYYNRYIWPDLVNGKNVIVAAHGNSLRALIMHIEKLSEAQILDRELATAAPQVYRLTPNGDVAEYRELVRSEGRGSGLG